MKRKPRNGQGRFEAGALKKAKPVVPEKISAPPDEGDDEETLIVQRVDTKITITAKNEAGRIVKAFVKDSSRYVIGKSHDFRRARNGSYHEVIQPPPVKRVVDYSEWIRKT